MKNVYFITEDNLIGSIATAILKLKKIKNAKSKVGDISSFIDLVKFIDSVKEDNFHDLLYSDNFFVSEVTLNNLHQELQTSMFSGKINFKTLIENLVKVIDKPVSEEIDQVMNDLKDIAQFLLQIKSTKQTYM